MSNLMDTILWAVAEVQGSISNANGKQIAAAYPYPQWNAPTAVLPFFVNLFRGGPTSFSASGGIQKVEGTVDMLLALQPATSGTSLAANQEFVMSWVEAVLRAFAAKMKLGNVQYDSMPAVREAYVKSWDNVIFTYGTTDYHGLKFELAVSAQFITAIDL